jgi:hypothetical protein
VTGITGGAIMAGGVIAGAIIGLTSATLATAVVVAILGLLFAVPVLVVLAAVALAIVRHLRQPDPDPGLCDDDGTGNCTRCAPVGDDAVRLVTGPSDADIERMIREWKGGRP